MTHSSTPHLPPLDGLLAALAAVKAGSFSGAALALGISHAAVSRRIEIVENWAGQRIFERHARGVVPTPDGQRILTRIAHALDQIEQLSHRRHKPQPFPVVRVGVTPSFARFWLLPRLHVLEGSPQDLRIEVVASLMHADLAGGEVDLAIRYGRGDWKEGGAEKLFDESLFPVMGSGLLPTGKEGDAIFLMSLPLLHSGDTTNWRTWAAAHRVPFAPKIADRTLTDYSMALEAAKAGLGVALWNRGLHSLDEFGITLVGTDRRRASSPLSYYLLSRQLEAHAPPALLAERIRLAAKAATPARG